MFTSWQWVSWAGVGLALTAALAGPAAPARAADDKARDTISRQDLDEQVCEALRQVIEEGREHFNHGYPGVCSQVFRGGLIAVKPLLGHHPRVQKAIEKGLADAQRLPTLRQEALELRKVIDSVRNEVAPTMPVAGTGDTLWERLGGEKGVTRMVNDWIDAAIDDPNVNFFRDGRFKMNREQINAMKRNIVLLASDIARGPDRYSGRNMLKVHQGMGITNDEFDAALSHLHRALLRNGVKPEDVDLVMKAAASTRQSIVQAGTPPGKAAVAATTMWERLGGKEGVTSIVNDWIDAAIADPQVNFDRNGKFPLTPDRVARLKKHLVQLASALGGGPDKYEGRRMLPAHKGMGITDDEFDAFVSKLKIALERNRVGELDKEIILKAVNNTRKDIVEVKAGKATAARPNNGSGPSATASPNNGSGPFLLQSVVWAVTRLLGS